ncbi:hypothetical protein [Blautia obeum]|uniref:Uncharacterized protein n=1 Tax=Blautia obeum TaxID=40520 RepID=A0A415LK26_9FIRM|nr:hypothetical protein [Blautia obeum]RHL48794.1 hypothetical protein DW021_05520 [Blautia obeum]
MTKTNVILATMDSVKTLEGMVLQPVKILEELGYGYKEEDACEGTGWTEYRYTGVNPDNPDDIAVVTVGERDGEQYVYLENEDGEDWRFKIHTRDNIITNVHKIYTPTEALEELQTMVTGSKYEDYVDYDELDDDDEVIDWDEICTWYNLSLHGTNCIESGDAEYKQIGFNEEARVVVLYVNTADAPEVTLYIDDDGTIYEVC